MGRPFTRYDGTVWLKKHWEISPFEWGGPSMSCGDIATTNNGLALDTRMTPRGGVERGYLAETEPGLATTDITMKRTQLDSVKTALARNLWDIDMRVHCGGMDLDNPFQWEEITRLCQARFATYTISGTTFNTDDEEQLIQLGVQAYDRVDIKRVAGTEQEAFTPGREYLTAVCVAKKQSGIEQGDYEDDCVVYAVTERDPVAATSYIMINENGGELGGWTSQALSFGSYDTDDVIGFGNFFVAVSHDADAIIYSDDQGVNQVTVTVSNPLCIAGMDDFFLLIGCDSGIIQVSYDNARTWSVLHNALATSNNIIDIQFSPDDYQIIYALTASEVIRTENGGESWHQVAAITGVAGNLTAFYVMNSKQVFVGTDAGEVWQSIDGGDSWSEQANIDFGGSGVKANVEIMAITGCSCGIVWLAYHDDTVASEYTAILRNVDAGASGMWFLPPNANAITTTNVISDIVCYGANNVLGVGGVSAGANDSAVLLK